MINITLIRNKYFKFYSSKNVLIEIVINPPTNIQTHLCSSPQILGQNFPKYNFLHTSDFIKFLKFLTKYFGLDY